MEKKGNDVRIILLDGDSYIADLPSAMDKVSSIEHIIQEGVTIFIMLFIIR